MREQPTHYFAVRLSHEAALRGRCYSCSKYLRDAVSRDYGYAVGKGRYGLTCTRCGRITFYDLRTEVGKAHCA